MVFNHSRRIVLAGVVGVVAIAALVILALNGGLFTYLGEAFQSAPATGSIADSVDPSPPKEGPDDENLAELDYEGPTSIYIEEGFDPEVTDLAFGADEPVSHADPTAPTRLSNRQIQRVLQDHQSELLRCYARELETNPDLGGDVEFDFAIRPDGEVAMVKVAESTLRSTSAEDCFVDRARHWNFPEFSHEQPTRFQINMGFRL